MKIILPILAIGLFITGTALAAPITGFNTSRPFAIGAPVGMAPNYSVQQMLNILFGPGINAATDQQKAGVWTSVSPPPYAAVAPLLAFEFTGSVANNNLQEFGIWTGYDTGGPINTFPIFFGGANPTATALIKWNDATSGTIISADPGVNTGAFSGIAWNWFGFYYQFSTGSMLYTYDDLNPGNRVSALAYEAPGGAAWALFFDGDVGLNPGASGYDFNDLVVKVESIKPVPVPEPSLMVLLGIAMMSVAGLRRWWRE